MSGRHRIGPNCSKTRILIIGLLLAGLTVQIQGPLQVKGEPTDLVDALLLYQAGNLRNTDINFQKVTEYYGLRWAAVDLASTSLTDDLLRYEAGHYYPTVSIDAANLSYLNASELAVLETAIDQYDSDLTLSPGATHTNVLVKATDDYGPTYPVFVRFQGSGGALKEVQHEA